MKNNIIAIPRMTAPCYNLRSKIAIIKQALAILPKKEKEIELLQFNYRPDADSPDTVIIRYSFKNALWYRIDGIKTTLNRHVVVRQENRQRQIHLTVQGFFRRNDYTISLLPQDVFISEAGKN